MLEPLLVVFTARSPGGVIQLTVKETVAVSPDGTVTVCEAPPLTLQFEGTERTTVWLAAERLVNVKVPVLAIVWLSPPSTVTV
jgi:hypothetical protein